MLTVDIEKTPFYRIGEKQGIKQGFEQGTFETALKFMREFNLPVDIVTEKLKLNKDDFLKFLNQQDSNN